MTAAVTQGTWSGRWVADALDISVSTDSRTSVLTLTDLVGMALRRNPRRAHLLVSTVLGKHIPTDPRLVYGAGRLLGAMVADALIGRDSGIAATGGTLLYSVLAASRALNVSTASDATAELLTLCERHAWLLDGQMDAGQMDAGQILSETTTVLGYAETATALGHSVADSLRADYLHSTRRPVAGLTPVSGFEEEHSHASSHLLLPEDPRLLSRPGPLVLVDDELSTGQTVINTITSLHGSQPRDRYVIAALVDLRSSADRRRLAATAADLGTRIDVVALAAGQLNLPEDALARGQRLVAGNSTTRDYLTTRDYSTTRDSSTTRDYSTMRDSAVPGLAAVSAEGAGVALATAAKSGGRIFPAGWPGALPEGGRHGFPAASRAAFVEVTGDLARTLVTALGAEGSSCRRAGQSSRDGRTGAGVGQADRRILVLGFEELMYAPLLIATQLATELAGQATVRFSTTTRSPVLAVDDPGYAIRTQLSFASHDNPADGPGPRYAYNISGDRDEWFTDIVLVIDSDADHGLFDDDGLMTQLNAVADQAWLLVLPVYRPRATAKDADIGIMSARDDVHRRSMSNSTPAVAPQTMAKSTNLPSPLRGPEFGSYPAADVSWLLTDLSDIELEAPTEEREEAIQSGGAHYAESLPVEFQPTAEYQQLFSNALAKSAQRLAHAVGVVTEMVLDQRQADPVLVSLARAGTPVGILMRRWAQFAHGLDLPHYAVSIVRGKGIDTVALNYLAQHHDPASIMFVDGWTGKGAITRELADAIPLANEALGFAAGTGFLPDMAVLADTGHCLEIYGTRDDYLIPSACLNSTVSGLVSRTVLNKDYLKSGQFHGAKFYAELAGRDVSVGFIDAVIAQFPAVVDAVARDWPVLRDSDRTATWAGWDAVEKVSADHGIGDINLIKPGVGETTRVLLRRVPWKILIRTDARAELRHIVLLAEQRGVDIELVDDLAYSCIGLIHPDFTRGAVGSSGRAASA
jgi:hypothetical protein